MKTRSKRKLFFCLFVFSPFQIQIGKPLYGIKDGQWKEESTRSGGGGAVEEKMMKNKEN